MKDFTREGTRNVDFSLCKPLLPSRGTYTHINIYVEYIRSIGFPRHLSSLKPGVWHSVSVAVDHLWVHVNGDEARAVLGHLARNLRMIAESHADGPARRTRSTSKSSRLRLGHASSPCGKSPQRDSHPRPKATGENEDTRGPQPVVSGYGGKGSFSSLQAFSTIRDGGRARCDVCSRGHECYTAGTMKGGEIARGAAGDGIVDPSSSEAIPRERCHVLWLSLVFVFVALASGMAVSFWLPSQEGCGLLREITLQWICARQALKA